MSSCGRDAGKSTTEVPAEGYQLLRPTRNRVDPVVGWDCARSAAADPATITFVGFAAETA